MYTLYVHIHIHYMYTHDTSTSTCTLHIHIHTHTMYTCTHDTCTIPLLLYSLDHLVVFPVVFPVALVHSMDLVSDRWSPL